MTGNSCCSTTQTASPLLNWRFATTGANAAGEPVRGRWVASRVWPAPSSVEGPEVEPQISCNVLDQDDLLSRLTPGATYDVDEMSATVEIPGSMLLPRLTEWEMQGRLMKTGGGRYAVPLRK